ncbi:YtzH-like family protein [Salipaludibacillus sp. HK11]|uniref:YtzH-like family protein n=1 Tax=Salipaludibacillus sp. HK11 TaxID=3394320 RepID=UPI0039FC6B06
MSTDNLLGQLQTILEQLQQKNEATKDDFNQLKEVAQELRTDKFNENFHGTIQEIHAFADKSEETNNLNELVQHHGLNLSRWIEEISLLIDGGGKVTIDYEQRKGREV